MAQHIFDRVDVGKYLRSLKTSQKQRYKEIKEHYGYQFKKLKIDPNKKNLSKKEIEIIKEKIRNKIIKERIIRNVIVSTITLTVAFLIYFFIISKFNLF